MTESDRIREILSSLPPNERLFRINSGMGWAGKVVRRAPGTLILDSPRPLHAAPTGWPDLCGFTTIEITPEMVGTRVAVFTGVEVKVTGRMSAPQTAFRDLLIEMGGIHRIDVGEGGPGDQPKGGKESQKSSGAD
jgi:hypothetical protein